MKTICFTGHRPDKLGGYNWNTKKNQDIIQTLRSKIIEIINSTNENHFIFICGGALGIDQMAFEVVKSIRDSTLKLNPITIELWLAVPFEKQDSKWFNQEDIQRFRRQLKEADKVIYVDTLEDYKCNLVSVGEYHPAKMQLRNQWMVDNSTAIVGVWNGTKGGTANCVNYAKKKGKEIVIINPEKI